MNNRGTVIHFDRHAIEVSRLQARLVVLREMERQLDQSTKEFRAELLSMADHEVIGAFPDNDELRSLCVVEHY